MCFSYFHLFYSILADKFQKFPLSYLAAMTILFVTGEHLWPRSYGLRDGTSLTDLHNIRPADVNGRMVSEIMILLMTSQMRFLCIHACRVPNSSCADFFYFRKHN